MTYCLAMRLTDGLVFLSDTRTNAGVDNVSTYRKLFVFHPAPDRTIVIQSAGNLATTQEVLDRIERDLTVPGVAGSLASGAHLWELALYLGIFAVLWARRTRPAPDGTIFAWYLVLHGIARFLVEFLRVNPVVALGLTAAQLMSVALVVAGTGVLLWGRRAWRPAAA